MSIETGERLDGLGATGADGQLDDERVGLQAVDDHLHGAVEVGADAVHLVDEAHARHLVGVGLAPHGLGLRLDAGDRVEHGDGAVEDAERTLDLDREVDVARGVDDVDPVVVPHAGGGSGGDRDAALLLLGHVVHGRRAVVHFTDLVALAGVVEDALGRRGLAGVDVRHDADVACAIQGELALGHLLYFTSVSRCGYTNYRESRCAKGRKHEVRVYRRHPPPPPGRDACDFRPPSRRGPRRASPRRPHQCP